MAIVAVGLLKPWGLAPGRAVPGVVAPSSSQPGTVAIAAPTVPGPTPSLDPHGTTGGPCYYGLAQRLFTSDTTSNGLVRTWYGLDPVVASGPGDESIPVVVVHSRTLGQLGYCLVEDSGGSSRILATLAWQLGPNGDPHALDLERASRLGTVDPNQGAVFEPPSAISGADPGIWPAATYVFEIQLQTAPAEWFAVRVS